MLLQVYISPCPCPLRVSLPVCPAAFGVFLFSFVFQLYLCLNFLFVLIIIYLFFVAFWGKFFVICLCLHYITIKSLLFNLLYICSLLCPDLRGFVLPLAVSSVRVYELYMPPGFPVWVIYAPVLPLAVLFLCPAVYSMPPGFFYIWVIMKQYSRSVLLPLVCFNLSHYLTLLFGAAALCVFPFSISFIFTLNIFLWFVLCLISFRLNTGQIICYLIIYNTFVRVRFGFCCPLSAFLLWFFRS